MAAEPQLARFYSEAMEEVYGVYIGVAAKHYQRFCAVEMELLNSGISLHNYAHTVARLWAKWCANKGLRTLPINVFLGQKSRSWYGEYLAFGVDVATPVQFRSAVLQDEFAVASIIVRQVMDGNSNITERSVLANLKLSPHWHKANSNGLRPRSEAAEAIASMVGIEATTTNYVALGELAKARCERQRNAIS